MKQGASELKPDDPSRETIFDDGVLSQDIDEIDRQLATLEIRLAGRKSAAPGNEVQSLIDRLSQPVTIHIADTIVHANRAASRLFGSDSPDLMIGRSQMGMVVASVRPAFEEHLAVLDPGAMTAVMVRCHTLSNRQFETSVATWPLMWSGRAATAWIFNGGVDTVPNDEFGKRSHRFKPGWNGDGLWDWNIATGVIYLGPRFKHMLGYGREDLPEQIKSWAELVHPDDLKSFEVHFDRHFAGQTELWEVEARFRAASGRYRWVHILGRAVRDDTARITRVVGTANDVDDARSMKGEMSARTDALDRTRKLLTLRTEEVSRLDTELSMANLRVDAAMRARNLFLANMSHELRTPLNAIMGFAEIINDEMFGPMSVPRYRDYAGDILHSAAHLLQVIDDILDLSMVEAGDASLVDETVDLPHLIRSVVRLVSFRIKDTGAALTTDFDPALPMLRGDARVLKQMVFNLLECAIKNVPNDGRVLIAVQTASGGGIDLMVEDDGIGMTSDQLRQSLAPLAQDDQTVAQSAGSGLGLPLVMAQIELHGGQFEIESAPGQGTKVWLHFPPERSRGNLQNA